MVGMWLLVPEHIRLGTWDLLCSWSGKPSEHIDPRLGLQLVNEAALCVTGIREGRHLSQRGFELANGLPFVASDQAIHSLLNSHTVAESEALQVHLGLLRRTLGHFQGEILALDPHRMRSWSKRQMARRSTGPTSRAVKISQTFFCLDADTEQPLCFTCGSSSMSVTKATPVLLQLAADILNPKDNRPLLVADTEHYSSELVDYVVQETPFDLLVPMYRGRHAAKLKDIPAENFVRKWAGIAIAKATYQMQNAKTGPHWQIIQRSGEREEDYEFKPFLATSDRDVVEDLAVNYPKRWHVEEFFNTNQALGWNRGGTLNLNIRYAQMTMALIAQAALHQLRQRLGSPYNTWNAKHFSASLLSGLDGDIRVRGDKIVVTFYRPPNIPELQREYENLPEKLERENINPRIPWLYNYKLDFRFR